MIDFLGTVVGLMIGFLVIIIGVVISPIVIIGAIITSVFKIVKNRVNDQIRANINYPDPLSKKFTPYEQNALRIIIIGLEGTYQEILQPGEGLDLFEEVTIDSDSDENKEPILTLRRSLTDIQVLELVLNHTSIEKLSKNSS